MDDEITVNGVKYRRVEDDKPAPALKYAPGQVVMMPMVVIEAEPQFDNDELAYRMQTLAHKTIGDYFLTRAAVELDPPAVGDTCWFWDWDGDEPKRGKLDRIDEDDDDLPYHGNIWENRDVFTWFAHCVKCQ